MRLHAPESTPSGPLHVLRSSRPHPARGARVGLERSDGSVLEVLGRREPEIVEAGTTLGDMAVLDQARRFELRHRSPEVSRCRTTWSRHMRRPMFGCESCTRSASPRCDVYMESCLSVDFQQPRSLPRLLRRSLSSFPEEERSMLGQATGREKLCALPCQFARLPDCQIARLPDCQIARLPDARCMRPTQASSDKSHLHAESHRGKARCFTPRAVANIRKRPQSPCQTTAIEL